MLWGYDLQRYSDWWPVFFYRFVDPLSRSGPNLNYADRVRDAHATVMPQQWVVYHCPPRRSAGRPEGTAHLHTSATPALNPPETAVVGSSPPGVWKSR
jgi:hypothetical protein